jgi:ubiquinone/menaquinone biosynthesis C-methylase UbiE
MAWDCATGNGQAARSLAVHFNNVIATDASSEQIASAESLPGIRFQVAPAEASGLLSGSVDLITVAQALHWFDIDSFFAEAVRVLKPGGILSFWCYERCKIDGACNDIIEKIFAEVEPYWPPERDLVERHYRDIETPVPEIAVDDFAMRAIWTADEMLSYMRTWSASQRYISDRKQDPTLLLRSELISAWGPARRTVTWPLMLRAGEK